MKFKIGEFSKINKITVKALRHYDEIGLLSPIEVDIFTGYRYYSAAQTARLQSILAYRDMGFSLADVKKFLDEPPDFPVLEAKIKAHETGIKSLMLKIDALQTFQKQLEGEKNMQEIQIKTLPRVIVASHRRIIKNYGELFDFIPTLLYNEMVRLGVECQTPEYCFNIYHDGEYKEADIDMEYCEAVTEMRPDTDILKFKIVDEVPRAACIMHIGPYETLRASYAKLVEYIADNALELAAPPRESYIDGIWNCDSPSDWKTEIQFPLK